MCEKKSKFTKIMLLTVILSLAFINVTVANKKAGEKPDPLNIKLNRLKTEYKLELGEDAYRLQFLTDRRIWHSKLYKFCQAMPKGADLHVHNLAILPTKELIDFLCPREDVAVCVDNTERRGMLKNKNSKTFPANYLPLGKALAEKKFTIEELDALWSLQGRPPQENIWTYFEKLFQRHSALGADEKLLRDYCAASFRYYGQNNISHLELKTFFFGTPDDSVAKAKAIRDAYYEVKQAYPDFHVKLIGQILKRPEVKMALIETLTANALYVHEMVKDETATEANQPFLTGIDFVNEEDASRPLLAFRPLINKVQREHPKIKLFIHAGESLSLPADNIAEACAWQAERIGHGFSLYRFPQLRKKIKAENICLEICPVSNNALGYCKDLRNHPAKGYLQEGLPIVLSSDDPSYFEHSTLTDDYMAAIICWDLNIEQIKQLCRNSIQYSSLDPSTKDSMLNKWEKAWQHFSKMK